MSIVGEEREERGVWLPPGARFFSWTVRTGPEVRSLRGGKRSECYECECVCGARQWITLSKLLARMTGSCGCVERSGALEERPTRSRLYFVWRALKNRCESPKNKQWQDYGGRGVGVCPEWQRDFSAFRAWALSHGYSPGLELDRIDNDGPYRPENCRFISPADNRRNKRAQPGHLAFGVEKTLKAWAADPRCEVDYTTLCRRVKAGMEVERALSFNAGGERRSEPLLWGEQKSVKAWSRDPRCVVFYHTVIWRLRAGWSLEPALTTPAEKGWGVSRWGKQTQNPEADPEGSLFED